VVTINLSTASYMQVVMEAVDKPRNIQYKGDLDLVTDTDKAAETACLAVIRSSCPDHAILGELSKLFLRVLGCAVAAAAPFET
jgi:fructose-1,6-bisphosphatase/inositol monophosphatase family enzyme